jgi:DNA invertase Pin-like site-specific DNA recombinase
MLRRIFDPRQPHRYVRYGRMSSDMQNPRSPEQQFDTIDLHLRMARHDWTHVRDYRDDAITGRFVNKRPGFQQMLSDLRSGRVQADLILIDTYERLGRADEIGVIRKQLQAKYKILVLTANTNFTDPTSSGGRALTVLEDLRATEDNNVKAHNVLRGKRDLAKLGRWPGGPVPAGFKLENIVIVRDGRQEVDGHRFVPDPVTRIAPTRAFHLAFTNGWGNRLIARNLNADPEIPAQLKPISEEQVRIWLRNTVYKGMLTYGRCHTGIVDDKYVREPAEPEELVIVEDFCEPLVLPEVFDKVNEMRRARAEARAPKSPPPADAEGHESDDHVPEARKYLLTGLVRCGECGGQMDLTSNPMTRSDGGKGYQYYKCRKYAAGGCTHRSGFREEVLKNIVIAKLRARLFPAPEAPDSIPSWLPGLAEEVRREVDVRSSGQGDPRTTLTAELAQIDDQVRGWSISLGNPQLSSAARAALETLLEPAVERRAQIKRRLAELEATRSELDQVLDVHVVLDRLRRLDVILARGNVAEGNRELRRVIDRVFCHADGRVELRTIRLGLFEGATSWLKPAKSSGGSAVNDGSLYWTDPVEYIKPPRAAYPSWPRGHAAEVLAKRQETGWSIRRLSQHYGQCWDTIKKALELAAPADSPSTTTDPS